MNMPRRSTFRARFSPVALATLAISLPFSTVAHAGPGATACSDTSAAGFAACQSDAEAEYQTAFGICENEAVPADETSCKAEAASVRLDALDLCDDQDAARADVCSAIGEAPYDPAIDPANFVDPAKIGHGIAPNRFFPITRGSVWTYKGGG